MAMTEREALEQQLAGKRRLLEAYKTDPRLSIEAPRGIPIVEGEITALNLQLARLADRERNADAARAVEAEHAARTAQAEEMAFWFRRFFTTLGIANGAAFAALASGLLQADEPVKLAPVVGPAMDAFIWGALWAGSIPLWMWARLRLRIYSSGGELRPPIRGAVVGAGSMFGQLIMISAAASVVLFCLGLFTATGAVHGLAEGKKVADARVAAESKARAHPIIPSALAPKPAK